MTLDEGVRRLREIHDEWSTLADEIERVTQEASQTVHDLGECLKQGRALSEWTQRYSKPHAASASLRSATAAIKEVLDELSAASSWSLAMPPGDWLKT